MDGEAGHGAPAGRSPLVDTHCHLDARQFADEPTEAVLERARAAGVTRVVTIGINLETSRRAIELADAHPGVYASVGVDPNDLDGGIDDATLQALEGLAASPSVVAIGEIGLDYYWDRAPHDVQKDAFRAQLELARSLEKPVVIHNRDAHADTSEALLGWAAGASSDGRPLGVLHCFSGDLPMAESLVAAGFLVSLAGNVTFKNAQALRDVARALPESALVFETDAPYLSPHPHRGRRNEPARVRLIAEHVAGLRATSVDVLAAATSANAGRLFGWNGSAS